MTMQIDTTKKYHILVNKNKSNHNIIERTFCDGLNVDDNFVDYYSTNSKLGSTSLIVNELNNQIFSTSYCDTRYKYIYDVEFLDDTKFLKLDKYTYKVDKVILKNFRKISDMEDWNDPVKTNEFLDVMPEWIEYMENPSQELIYKAVKGNPKIIETLTSEQQSELICMEAVKQDGLLLKYVKCKSESICFEAVKQNGNAFKYVPKNMHSELLLITVLKKCELLHGIDNDLQTPLICLEAVKFCGTQLQFVNESLITEELCLEAVKNNGSAIKYVPEKYKSEQVIKVSLLYSFESLQYVENQTEELVLYALKNRGDKHYYGETNVININITHEILSELFKFALLTGRIYDYTSFTSDKVILNNNILSDLCDLVDCDLKLQHLFIIIDNKNNDNLNFTDDNIIKLVSLSLRYCIPTILGGFNTHYNLSKRVTERYMDTSDESIKNKRWLKFGEIFNKTLKNLTPDNITKLVN